MGLKITLITGEVVEVDLEDYLQVDFFSTDGKAAMQDIINFKDNVKHWNDVESAETEDSLKFIDKKESSIADATFEDFEQKELYIEIIKKETGIED